jgi:hypothetical protein
MCDDVTNNAACDYDGGDCCGDSVNEQVAEHLNPETFNPRFSTINFSVFNPRLFNLRLFNPRLFNLILS